MAYPGTHILWKDNSAIPAMLPIVKKDTSPLFFALFTSDAGPEGLNTVVGEEFFDLYCGGNSTISFNKHGQPLLQAAMMINKGAKLYCKRIVAKDATLANIGVIATITGATPASQATDTDGNPLYYAKDPATGENTETTTTSTTTDLDSLETVDNDPVMTPATSNTIKYEPFSVEGATTTQEIYDAFKKEYNAEGKRFPLFIFTENGRGVSTKSWSISPNYELSKTAAYMVYDLTINTTDENKSVVRFTFNPDYILNGKSYCLQQRVLDESKQLKCKQYDGYITEFIEAVAKTISTDTAPVTYSDIINQDILFGHTRKGVNTSISEDLAYDTDDMNLDAAYGNKLINGSNGSFGNHPTEATGNADKTADTYEDAMVRAFDENIYPEIYDPENNKFIAAFDANYPKGVKAKLEQLAIHREDFIYVRDGGVVGLNTLSEIEEWFLGTDEVAGVARSRFIVPYPIYGDVYDPYTQKQITVTANYLLSTMFINHCEHYINMPFCGQRYNVVLDFIPGTVNFIPSVTPQFDQKTTMIDLRINYCAYHNEILTIETNYTSQEEYTQYSFANNVTAVQAVIREIRTRCPVTRYATATVAGLAEYEQDINERVILHFKDWFEVLKFMYVGDDITLANKQYYAAIEVKFADFIMSEHFTITALPSVDSST